MSVRFCSSVRRCGRHAAMSDAAIKPWMAVKPLLFLRRSANIFFYLIKFHLGKRLFAQLTSLPKRLWCRREKNRRTWKGESHNQRVELKKSDLGCVTHSVIRDIWPNVTVWNYGHENTYITEECRNLVGCMTGQKKLHQRGHKKQFPSKKDRKKNKFSILICDMAFWSLLLPNLMTFALIEQMGKLQLAQWLLNMTYALWPPVWPI